MPSDHLIAFITYGTLGRTITGRRGDGIAKVLGRPSQLIADLAESENVLNWAFAHLQINEQILLRFAPDGVDVTDLIDSKGPYEKHFTVSLPETKKAMEAVESLVMLLLASTVAMADRITLLVKEIHAADSRLWAEALVSPTGEEFGPKRIIRNLVEQFNVWAVGAGKGFAAGKLALLADWRNRRLHEKFLFAFVEGLPNRVLYATAMNGSDLNVGTVERIDSHELTEAIVALQYFLAWFYEETIDRSAKLD